MSFKLFMLLFCAQGGGGKSQGSVDLGWTDDEVWIDAEVWDDAE